MTGSEKIFYDLFSDGRWIGMAQDLDEDDAKRMAARSLPTLCGRFTLVRWYGRLHPDNCKTSGGSVPDPEPEAMPEDRTRLRRLVDIVWNEATESAAVPSTIWADRMIDRAFRIEREA